MIHVNKYRIRKIIHYETVVINDPLGQSTVLPAVKMFCFFILKSGDVRTSMNITITTSSVCRSALWVKKISYWMNLRSGQVDHSWRWLRIHGSFETILRNDYYEQLYCLFSNTECWLHLCKSFIKHLNWLNA